MPRHHADSRLETDNGVYLRQATASGDSGGLSAASSGSPEAYWRDGVGSCSGIILLGYLQGLAPADTSLALRQNPDPLQMGQQWAEKRSPHFLPHRAAARRRRVAQFDIPSDRSSLTLAKA